MFTGIVEAIGTLVEVTDLGGGRRLRLETDLAPQLHAGDSLAVDGVCLTVVRVEGLIAQFDIGPETARVTTLGAAAEGRQVNLERSMRADGRFGGHFVLGHADGVGRVEAVRAEGDGHWLSIAAPRELAPYLIPKGSVAVDGVSLTVARLGRAEFDVQIIPFTWEHTTLHRLRAGDQVNLECDVIGKYVQRSLELRGPAEGDR